MRKYVSPEIEVVEFKDANVVTESACEYECPDSYGSTCTGNPYGGF